MNSELTSLGNFEFILLAILARSTVPLSVSDLRAEIRKETEISVGPSNVAASLKRMEAKGFIFQSEYELGNEDYYWRGPRKVKKALAIEPGRTAIREFAERVYRLVGPLNGGENA